MPEVASDERPLTFADLVGWLEAGAKPKSQWRVGAEHEKFPFRLGSHEPVPYEGAAGIKALLSGLMRFGWEGVYEDSDDGPVLIALSRDGASVSLEPGGQFELSGAPLETMHDICTETGNHLHEVKTVCDELGLGMLGLGFTPVWTREQAPVMPKGRYGIMRRYMPKVGKLGLDMMFRTCTVQANLDFASEADMVAKFRTSLALQPIATALFANSPFIEGKPSGFLSARANVWTDTDPDRTGMLDFVFEDGFGFETYARYALDVPMYFLKRDGRYVDNGRAFVPALHGPRVRRPPRRPADPEGLGRSRHHHLPRGEAQTVPGDARRRLRPLDPVVRTAGAVDRGALRFRSAVGGLGPLQGLDGGGARCASRRRGAAGAQGRGGRAHGAGHSPGHGRHRPRGP
jgi:glutamate--cysteine ligase